MIKEKINYMESVTAALKVIRHKPGWKDWAQYRRSKSTEGRDVAAVGYITVICMPPRARLLRQHTTISQSAVEDRSSSTNDSLRVACYVCYIKTDELE